jgi:protein SCO1
MAANPLRTFRIVLWAAVAIVAVAATIAYVTIKVPKPGGPAYGAGDYTLEQASGGSFTEASLRGAPSMLFFGYTHCPDVCPTTLAEMDTWFQALGDSGKKLKAFFVTVDPERDTAAVLGDYVGWLDGKVTAVTGSPVEVDKMLKAWGITAEKVVDGDDYSMNHTASVFLLNADGGFEGTISYGEDKDAALAKLKRLVGA